MNILGPNKSCSEVACQEEQRYLAPRVNITENKDAYLLTAEMPGVSKQGLEILLEGNEITIVGHREHATPTNMEVIYRETKPMEFRRVFELDPAINTSRIEAKIEQGVLALTLPKSEAVKPRKITISE
jgi:HSP20 family protein